MGGDSKKRPIGWVAMKGARVVGELRPAKRDAERDAEKLGEGGWVAPIAR